MADPARTGGRRLPLEMAMLRVTDARHRLPRVLGTGQLVILGLGVMIGAGIFSLSGVQAATNAGPAVIVSFLIAAAVCFVAALSYAELSSTIPVAGSAYTFSYVVFGELWGWLVGWALILELLVAAAVVSRAWSSYFVATLHDFDLALPSSLEGHAAMTGTNLIAPVVVLVLTVLILTGSKLSARVLTVVVLAKVAVIALVVAVGVRYIDTSNYSPLVPEARPRADDGAGSTVWSLLFGNDTAFGVPGVFAAAAVITFAYIGFDLIATATEDAREPRRSVPRAMLIGVVLVTVMYVAMAVVLVGIRPYTELGTGAPVSDALRAAGVGRAATLVNLGGLLAFTTVVMVVLIAQSRVLFAMGRDGLLPSTLGHVSHRYSSPARACALAGIAAAAVAMYPAVASLEQVLVVGALFTFFFCSVGVLVLRRSQPGLERGFRVPAVPWVPLLSAAAIVWLGLSVTPQTWRNFGVWMAVGLILYLGYGRWHSHLAPHGGHSGAVPAGEPERPPGPGRHSRR